MADRLLRLPDAELGLALTDLGSRLDYPVAADLTAVVVERVSTEPGRRPGFLERLRELVSPPGPIRSLRRSLVLAFAVLVLLAAAAAAVGFGIRGIQIIFSPSKPRATSAPVGAKLFLGRPSSVADAQQVVSFPVAVPGIRGLPEPEVYVSLAPSGGSVSLVYPAGPGLPQTTEAGVGMLLTEFRGRVDRDFIRKFVFQGTRIHQVTVNGEPGLWIAGAPHEIVFLDENGDPFSATLRVAGSTLVWTRGGVTLRLESALSRTEALRIARSIR